MRRCAISRAPVRPRGKTSTPDLRQGQPRTNKRQCGIQPAHQSLITDVFRSRPLLCTIHHLINSTLASVENVPVVPAVLDKGHQSKLLPKLQTDLRPAQAPALQTVRPYIEAHAKVQNAS